MDTARANRNFEDFDPVVEWRRAAEADAVKLSLPGFRREDVKVLVDNHGNLRTRGERLVAGTSRWSRFQKDFKLPENCNVDGIRARFESETLTIMLPKKNPSPQTQVAAPVSVPAPPKPEPRRPAAAPQQPPLAVPEPARPAPPPTVPATPLAPAPSQKQQPAERRPSLPSRLPSVPTPAEVDEPPKKKSETPAAAVPQLMQRMKEKVEEEKRTEKEAMGKMKEDMRMMMKEKQEQAKDKAKDKEEEGKAAINEMEVVHGPRPMAANRGLLVNVAVAVVVLVGITAYVWHNLRNAATGGHRDEL